MKKFLYSVILVVVMCASFSSCTEEVVKPKEGAITGSALKE